MRIFVCSDWHLGHETLVTLGHRPKDFERLIIENLDLTEMEPGDILLNLGDVYLHPAGEAMTEAALKRLKERGVQRILVAGNHDSTRFWRLMRMGWSWVCDSTTIHLHGKRFLFTHAPVEVPFDEDLNVHGHLHQVAGHRGGLIRDRKHVLISMELLRYRPVPLETVARLGQTPVYAVGKFVGEGDDSGQRAALGAGNVEESQDPR